MSGRTKDKTRNLAFSKLPAHHTYLKWTAYDRPKPCELLVIHSVIAILLVYLFMIHVVRFFWELSKRTFMSEGFRFYCVVIVIGNRKDNRRQSKWPGHVVRQSQEGWRQESKWPGQLPPTMLYPLPLSDFLPPVISALGQTMSRTSLVEQLDPVGSTVRYDMMNLCTLSVLDSNGCYFVVLSQ